MKKAGGARGLARLMGPFRIYIDYDSQRPFPLIPCRSIVQLSLRHDFFLIGVFWSQRILFLPRLEGLDYSEGASTGFMIASGGVPSEEYGHGGPGVCLGDGQTEAEGVSSQGGRGDALLRRMSPHLI